MEPTLVLQQGLGLAVLLVVPLVLGAILGSVLAAIIGHLAGISDPAFATVLRAVGVVLAAVLLAGMISDETVAFARHSFGQVAAAGNGG